MPPSEKGSRSAEGASELEVMERGEGWFRVRNKETGNICTIEDTFSEMFPMWLARIMITAANEKWALTAGQVTTGFASSIIASPAEAGIERVVPPAETPDKRPGCIIHLYHRFRTNLRFQLISRIGQCVLTCPTTAAFNALSNTKRKVKAGEVLSQFGDGYAKRDSLYNREVWRIPVMEGEFVIEETFGMKKAIAGGMFLIMAENATAGLKAAEGAVGAAKTVEGIVLPFPGGICRSGSKVGSRKYKLGASTNDAFCPSLRGRIEGSQVPENVTSVYEIVINGINFDSVSESVARAIDAATRIPGIVKITSSNYGGKLGPYKLQLKDLIEV